MSYERLPSYDPSHGIMTRRAGKWVESWNLRNGVAWRDPALAERAVAGWHERRAVELQAVEPRPALSRKVVKLLRPVLKEAPAEPARVSAGSGVTLLLERVGS